MSVLQQEPPGRARFCTQVVLNTKLVLAQQELPRGNLQDCLKSPPEDLVQELVKCFVMKVVMSWVCHIVSAQSIVSKQLSVLSMQGRAEEFLDHSTQGVRDFSALSVHTGTVLTSSYTTIITRG